MREWTPSQRTAFTARGCSLVVSAAAGSGKTSVLTERLVRLLAEEGPWRVDAAKLAVVTFTKAAAAELESRLYEGLSREVAAHPENSSLTRQLLRLSRAQISTIHSFCFALIKFEREAALLPENVRICDPAEASMLLESAAESAMEAFLAEGDREARDRLFRLFGNARSDEEVKKMLIDLKKSMDAMPRGIEALREKAVLLEEEVEAMESGRLRFFASRLGKELIDGLVSKATGGAALLRYLNQNLVSFQDVSKYIPVFESTAEALERFAEELRSGNYTDAKATLESAFPPKLPPISSKSAEGDIKEAATEHYKAIKAELSVFFDLYEQEPLAAADTRQSLEIIQLLLVLFDGMLTEYNARKSKRAVVDYNDLEHLALRLLAEYRDGEWVETERASKMRDRFDAVFVDEYQDTNELQDLIFRLISKQDNLFLVGDPKQSIYRFRGAQPSVFTHYKNSFPSYQEGKKGMQTVFLSDNFRCDKSIIDLCNAAFRVMMDASREGSLYGKADELKFSKKAKTDEEGNLKETPTEHPAELVLLDYGGADRKYTENEKSAVEAEWIAARIKAILEGEIRRDDGSLFEANDVAVLCRTNKQLLAIRDALDEHNIRCSRPTEEKLQETPEYLFVSSFFEAVDNPGRDVPLLATLCSPVFRFRPDDLYRIRNDSPEGTFWSALLRYAEKSGVEDETAAKCREFITALNTERDLVRQLSLSGYIYRLYRRYTVAEFFSGASPSPVEELFLATAASADATSVTTLSEFLELAAHADGSAETVEKIGVSLLTLHKSKGLEFPIVFLPGLEKPWYNKWTSATLQFSPSFGILTAIPKLDGKAKFNTMMRQAVINRRKKDELDEQKRVLYVGMTRAEKKLFLVGSIKNANALEKSILSFAESTMPPAVQNYLIGGGDSYLDMLLSSLRSHSALRKAASRQSSVLENGLRVSFVSAERVHPLIAEEAAAAEEESSLLFGGEKPLCAENEPFSFEDLAPYLHFSYRHKAFETLPKKLSVSQILHEDRTEEKAEYHPLTLMDFSEGRLKSTASAIGTATHRVMQFLDFARAEADLDGELERLRREEFLSPEDLSLAETDKLRAFFSSKLYESIRKSPRVEHERRFNVLLPADAILGREGEVLVQGVIDLYFENPDGTLTLVDFKTDRVRGENAEKTLLERHAEQLRLYRRAVEAFTEKTVSRLSLYSFALGKEIFVPLE